MTKNRKDSGTDWSKFDTHVVQPDEYKELPEWTDEMFEQADLYEAGKLIKRGRPKKDNPKIRTAVRLDADILSQFRATGKGWQTNINNALRDWLERRI